MSCETLNHTSRRKASKVAGDLHHLLLFTTSPIKLHFSLQPLESAQFYYHLGKREYHERKVYVRKAVFGVVNQLHIPRFLHGHAEQSPHQIISTQLQPTASEIVPCLTAGDRDFRLEASSEKQHLQKQPDAVRKSE